MKHLKYILLVFILSLSAASCSDYLDVRPENELLLEEFWQKESDVEGMVLACYRTMLEDDFMWRLIIWGELRSDNVIPSSGAANEEKQINNVNILPTNYNCSWNIFYKVINYCNLILEYAPGVMELDADFTESDLQAKLAEALAIRSLCYFYLVRTFRDIPLSLVATTNDRQDLQLAQSSPADVLEHITKDLLQAEQWALNDFVKDADTKGRMTKDAIRALLADIYLWRGEYAKCVEYCDLLINAKTILTNMTGTSQMEVPKYEVIEELSSALIFSMKNSSESIFELQFSSQDKTNDKLIELYRGGLTNTMGKLQATSAYVGGTLLYPISDERKADFIVVAKTESGEYPIFKYMGSRSAVGAGTNTYFYNSITPNWIIYRITDIMLMKAEALVQLNRTDEDLKSALSLVNKTYMRANPTLLETDSLSFENYASASSLERLVLLERQRELIFEGKRWFDLVRHSERKKSTSDLVGFLMNKYSSNQNTVSSKLSVLNALYFPIPESDLKVNKLLVQNPYYETSSSIVKQ